MTAIVKRENDLAITDMKGALKIADDCAKLIREKNLSVKIQGRDFVKAEGWQFAGTQLGLLPMVSKPVRLERNSDEIIYECECRLRNLNNGEEVGYGYALCSNFEPTKKMFAEYAIASMAQTRAEGKAYRNLIAWIMQASGFEPTPAEEMDEINVEAKAAPTPTPKTRVTNVYDEPKQAPPPAKETKIDITKDEVTVGKFKGKVWKDLPSHYLQALREEKYWTTLSPTVQKAVLDSIEYQSKRKAEKEIKENKDFYVEKEGDSQYIKQPEQPQEGIVFDNKGDIQEAPTEVAQPKTLEVNPQDKQLALIVQEWDMPELLDEEVETTQDQKDFLSLLTSSSLFTDQERQLVDMSLKQWRHNTTALQTKIYIVQFKQRFLKKYKASADTIK